MKNLNMLLLALRNQNFFVLWMRMSQSGEPRCVIMAIQPELWQAK